MMEKTVKPPTQGIGVAGFKADLYASDEKHVAWEVLIHLPKFQMYAVEVSRLSHENVMEWIDGFMKDQVYEKGQKGFFNHYQQWHDAKGYWKNETVYGELI